MDFDELYADLMQKNGVIFEAKAPKAGDMVPFNSIPEKDFVFEMETGAGAFRHILDPTDGAGGSQGFEDAIFYTAAREFKEKHGEKYSSSGLEAPLNFWLPKSKELQKLAQAYGDVLNTIRNPWLKTPQEKRALREIQDEMEKYLNFAYVRTTEKYKIIVDEEVYNALPNNVIGSTEYDYSFHAGEGNVSGWLIAIGKSRAEALKNVKAGLQKAKFQYVGSEMELRQMQKSAVGRYD